VTKEKQLNVVAFTIEGRLPNNDHMFSCLGKLVNLELRRLTRSEAKKFYRYITPRQCAKYDRVLVDIPFKYMFNNVKKIRKIQNIIFLNEDLCQNYIEGSKWFGRFSKFYASLPQCRILASGYTHTQTLKAEGIDACFVGKAFDETLILNQELERDIEYAFVGRINSNAYSERKAMLSEVSKHINLETPRANPGAEYNALLNRIVFFVSADVGLGEYMIKNFEALAAGCLLCAFRQGEEDTVIGFKDMENALLYSNSAELIEKINTVSSDLNLKKSIRRAGTVLAASYNYHSMSVKLFDAISRCFVQVKPSGVFGKIKGFLDV
tara:strand:+ start:56444 stop:57412 length:969 start_codon:yes stop_codon:yes gene_type:complete